MYPEPSSVEKLTQVSLKGSQTRLKSIRKEQRAIGINTPGFTDYYMFGGGGATTSSGARVSENTAMKVNAVWSCVTFIADYVASLPKVTYKYLKPSGKEKAENFYLYDILHEHPNPWQNDYEFVETMTGHVLLWGNAYAEIQRDGAGRVTALWPLRPDRMRIVILPDQLVYFYTVPNGSEQILREVFHLRGMGSDGIIGYSPIQYQRESIGLAFAEEEYRSRFFSNNASPGGVLQHPGRLGKEAADNLRRQWEQAHGGLSNSQRVAVLEEGIQWKQIGMPGKDMEFIEGRKYQKAEIAAMYHVRPYKIGLLEPGTVSYASIEQQAIDTHMETMRPWTIRWEKKFMSLLTPAEQKNYFVKFNTDSVLRGDSKTRAENLRIWRENGIINANEWRDIEDMNVIDGVGGDDYWRPSNYTVVGAEPVQQDLFPAPAPNGAAKPLNGAAH
jgi:HK97 family phage portal protein